MHFSRIIDISWPVNEKITEYKDVKEIQVSSIASFKKDGYRKSTVTLSSHTGTHVDAPSHFLELGSSIGEIPLTQLIGTCTVIDMTHVSEQISASDLATLEIFADDIILFKTKNSLLASDAPFDKNFVFIAADAAQLLANKQVKAVGIDYLGIERNQPSHETHCILFEHNVAIIEGLRLENVGAGQYFLCCLPLAMTDGEAAPARAVLLA